MRTTTGEVINLIWPDGNDEGEIFIRGHYSDKQARNILLRSSGELEEMAIDSLELGNPDETNIIARCHDLVGQARIERVYARWSQESSDHDLGAILRAYRNPGKGRFQVTRAKIFPRPPCSLSFQQHTEIYRCLKCGRKFRGPTDPYNLTGPADCDRLIGDEQVQEFTRVYEDLEPPKTKAPA